MVDVVQAPGKLPAKAESDEEDSDDDIEVIGVVQNPRRCLEFWSSGKEDLGGEEDSEFEDETCDADDDED